MTPRIEKAVEALRTANFWEVGERALRLIAAIEAAKNTHKAVPLGVLADAREIIENEADDTEGRAEGYSRSDKADSMRDVRKFRKIASQL